MADSASRSGSSATSSTDEDGWLDAHPEDNEEPQEVVSLLDGKVFDDAAAMLAYCRDEHQFDFLAIRTRLGLDFYGTVKLINYIRQCVRSGQPVKSDAISAADLDRDDLLKPVLENDALIFCLDSLDGLGTPGKAAAASAAPAVPAAASGDAQVAELQKKNEALASELETLTRQFESYRVAVQKTLDQRWGIDEDAAAPAATQAAPDVQATAEAKNGSTAPSDKKTGSDYYFESYAYNDIHETMLKDAIRTDAYRDFIYGHKHLFAGKTVLDIGCGTGILSMFCAKAGAKLVIAVDRSEILNKARENIFRNGLDKQITCLKGLIEDVVLPVAQVDIIVSEWMGYALLYEAMLPSVLYARDKYLAPDGLLVPSHASLWLAPVCDPEYVCDSVTFWRDVYGFDMQAMQDGIYDDARAVVQPPAQICGSPSLFRMLDLHTVTAADLVFSAPWSSTLAATGPSKADSLDGFLVWFDIYFGTSRQTHVAADNANTAEAWKKATDGQTTGSAARDERVAFSTGPFTKDTHWKQCLLLAKSHSQQLLLKADTEVSGSITFATAADNPRALTLDVTWALASDGEGRTQKQSWALN